MMKAVNILGIRGIPAAHGGFETFAHNLAPYLLNTGWRVTVYCQHDAQDPNAPPDGLEDEWQGIHRIHLRVDGNGPFSTMKFDARCVRDVIKRPGIDLVLGYNTAIFSVLQRLAGRRVVMNMDGIEWKRDKWSSVAKIWFWINELVGAHMCNVPIADHPEIARHLERHWTRNIEVIPYGSRSITEANVEAIQSMGLEPDNYLVSIARAEPENSILEVVRTFSSRKRGMKLVVLGNFRKDNAYHERVMAAASDEVIFPGAIFDPQIVSALRFYARAYVHGHQVGGTNPSLVEALGAGNAVIAHDNRFNRWVAGDGHFYFADEKALDHHFVTVSADRDALLSAKRHAVDRHKDAFTLEKVHASYDDMLNRVLEAGMVVVGTPETDRA